MVDLAALTVGEVREYNVLYGTGGIRALVKASYSKQMRLA